MQEVLSDASRQASNCPLVIGGDFNLDALKEAAAVAIAKAGFQDAVAVPRTPNVSVARAV